MDKPHLEYCNSIPLQLKLVMRGETRNGALDMRQIAKDDQSRDKNYYIATKRGQSLADSR